MLQIYPVCLDMVREVAKLAEAISKFDRDHARQLRRSCLSVSLNVAEGSGSRGGTRRARYDNALGSARETVANLESAEAIGYVGPMDPDLRNKLNHIIGVLVKIVH